MTEQRVKVSATIGMTFETYVDDFENKDPEDMAALLESLLCDDLEGDFGGHPEMYNFKVTAQATVDPVEEP